jgi:ribonucleoside-diphosphate reductase alpha chain
VSRRNRLPNRRTSITHDFEFENHRYRATVSRFDDGSIGEIFLDAGKVGSSLQHHASTGAILTSLLLQHGVAPETIRKAVNGPIAIALDHFAKIAVLA